MPSDNFGARSYASFMDGGHPYISLHVDFERPIEVGDFVGLFTSLSSQYEKFIRANHPDLAAEAEIYVKEVRPGSIEADLLPWLFYAGLPAMIHTMDQIQIVENFVRVYGQRLGVYFERGGRDAAASKSDLKDLMGCVAAIANDPNGSSRIEAVAFEDGKRQIRASIKFTTDQARIARDEIQAHRLEMEKSESADHERVLMVFSQSNVKDFSIGKRTGERVIIPDISDKERALVYASDLAEQRIKYEIREADDNVYKKGFIVDVNVQMFNGKPVAYRVTNFHHTIDMPDED